MTARAAVVALLAVALALPGAAAAAPSYTNLPWPQAAPPLPTSTAVQPRGVRTCRIPTLRCVDFQIKRMTALRARFGCDHRAIFATTYLVLTKVIREVLAREPRFYMDRRYLYTQDALFANYYFDTIRNWEQGKRVPEAWRIAFETARSGEVNAGQDMLLGINAHVQRDMPFLVARLGVRTRGGVSRKTDHDAGNEVLRRAYEQVVDTIARDYDPLITTSNASWNPFDDIGGLELVKYWREGVWRNAERLLNATSADERRQVSDEIESNAAEWAQSIAQTPQPGYRATRDAYCASR